MMQTLLPQHHHEILTKEIGHAHQFSKKSQKMAKSKMGVKKIFAPKSFLHVLMTVKIAKNMPKSQFFKFGRKKRHLFLKGKIRNC